MDRALTVDLSDGDADLDGILALQRENLRSVVSPEARARDGFVTAEHTREVLLTMHAELPSVVARQAGTVIGYALSMPLACRDSLPVLVPMFEQLDRLTYGGRRLSAYPYYVMGQICIAAEHRGRGLFDALYAAHARYFADAHELLVTEISACNGRSLRAHERVGFTTIGRYTDATDAWVVVAMPLRAAR